MMGMRKGLFGSGMMPAGMASPYSMPQAMGVQDGASLAMPAPQEAPKSWLDGGKFTTRDGIALALGTLGSAFGRSNTFGQFLLGNHMQRRQAEQQQKLFEQQRAAGLQDYEAKKRIDQQYAAPEQFKPRFEQDGAGNLWALDPVTGQPLSDKPVFVDRTERYVNQNGNILRLQNPFAGPSAPPASDAPETLPADFFKGGTAGNGGGNFPR